MLWVFVACTVFVLPAVNASIGRFSNIVIVG